MAAVVGCLMTMTGNTDFTVQQKTPLNKPLSNTNSIFQFCVTWVSFTSFISFVQVFACTVFIKNVYHMYNTSPSNGPGSLFSENIPASSFYKLSIMNLREWAQLLKIKEASMNLPGRVCNMNEISFFSWEMMKRTRIGEFREVFFQPKEVLSLHLWSLHSETAVSWYYHCL